MPSVVPPPLFIGLSILLGMALTTYLALVPPPHPLYFLTSLQKLIGQQNIYLIFQVAWGLHILEAIVILVLSIYKGFKLLDVFAWTFGTFLFGYGVSGSFMKAVRTEEKGKKRV